MGSLLNMVGGPTLVSCGVWQCRRVDSERQRWTSVWCAGPNESVVSACVSVGRCGAAAGRISPSASMLVACTPPHRHLHHQPPPAPTSPPHGQLSTPVVEVSRSGISAIALAARGYLVSFLIRSSSAPASNHPILLLSSVSIAPAPGLSALLVAALAPSYIHSAAMTGLSSTLKRTGALARMFVCLSILLLLLSHTVVSEELEVTDEDTAADAPKADENVPIYPEPPKKVDSDPAIPALLAWLHSRRVNTSAVRLIDTPYGRGLAAARSLKVNATIFSIPHSLLLTTDYVQEESALAEELSELEPTDAFALWLAHYRHSNKTMFHPYLASLPSFAPLPLFFAPQLIDEFKGTLLDEMAATRRGMAYSSYERLPHDLKQLASRADFLWALSQLWSRTFGVAVRDAEEKSGWRSVAALVPLADMLNTGQTVNVRCRTSKAGTSFQCTALRPIAAGEELLVSYGPKNNAQLVHDYGFGIWDNSNDFILLQLPSPKHNKTRGDSQKVAYRKMEVEDQWNREYRRKESELRFKLYSRALNETTLEAVLGAELYGWARLNVIDAADVKRMTAYEMIEAMRAGRSFSRTNDLRAIKLTQKQLQLALANYPTKTSDDLAQLTGEAGKRLAAENTPLYWSVLVRWSEKRILDTVSERIAVEVARVEAEAKAEVEERKREKERREAEKREKEEKERQKKLEKERQRREEDAREALKQDAEEEEEDAQLEWLDSGRHNMELRRAMEGAAKHNELR